MTSEQKKPGGKTKTIKSISRDLQNGAWNNLQLSRKSKSAITGASLIIIFGGITAANLILNKK